MSQEPAETYQLENDNMLAMLREFGEWLQNARFKNRKGGFLECADIAEVEKKCEPLLTALGYKVQSS